ncbi:MAG: hypothetical protein ABJ056_08515 [Halioglobus sp.]
MKYLLVFTITLLTAVNAMAEHNGGDDLSNGENASCNASFNRNCVAEFSYSADSSGFAAPAGELGSSLLEGAVLSLSLIAWIMWRTHRSTPKHARNNTTARPSSEQVDAAGFRL